MLSLVVPATKPGEPVSECLVVVIHQTENPIAPTSRRYSKGISSLGGLGDSCVPVVSPDGTIGLYLFKVIRHPFRDVHSPERLERCFSRKHYHVTSLYLWVKPHVIIIDLFHDPDTVKAFIGEVHPLTTKNVRNNLP